MRFKSTPDTYGLVAKTLHWLIALCVIGMLIWGAVLDEFKHSDFRELAYGLHKSLGITILLLMVLRLLWRLYSPAPAVLNDIPRWQAVLGRIAHWLFYVLIIAMPLSGLIMSSAGKHPATFFFLFNVSLPIAKSKEVSHFFKEMHEWLAWGIAGLVSLHVLAVLKHHFLDKSRILKRML